MRLWMGKHGHRDGEGGRAFAGVGPSLPRRVGRQRGEAYRRDTAGVWRAGRRMVDGQQFSQTGTPPAKSRKHRHR